MTKPRNVLGTALVECGRDPVTGFFRDGSCQTAAEDVGRHVVCAEMTAEFLEFTRSRILFGRPLSHTQTVQRRLAEMCRRITTAQLLALQLGRLKDRGSMHHAQVSMAKWNNVRMALDVARDARDILGAGGISIEFASIRHMLNLESVITYEGTETIHQLVVGKELTGVNAF